MKKFPFIFTLIIALFICSVPYAVNSAERNYIAPTFTPNTNDPTIGTTVKSVLNVNGKYYHLRR